MLNCDSMCEEVAEADDCTHLNGPPEQNDSGCYYKKTKERKDIMIREQYKAIVKLHNMLTEAEIPHDFGEIANGAYISYPSDDHWGVALYLYNSKDKNTYERIAKRTCSAVEHDSSYGRGFDMIELMGMLRDSESQLDDVVVLECDEVFRRIKEVEDKKKGIDPWREDK